MKELSLVRFNKSFITDEYLSWLNDKSNIRYSEQRHFTHTFDSCVEYLSSLSSNNHFFAVIYGDVHVGNIMIYNNLENFCAEVSILFMQKEKRKYLNLPRNLALDAWCLGLDYSFNVLNVNKVFAGTLSINQSMIKIFNNSGMNFEACFYNHYYCDDAFVDIVFYSKFNTFV